MNAARVPNPNERLCDTIKACLPDIQRYCSDPWTVIGSAAASLSGADIIVSDLDILTSRRDAKVLIERWSDRRDISYLPADGDRFRSLFARFRFPALPVEIMGGLECFSETLWQLVSVADVVTVDVAGHAVPIPAVSEQIRILECFGRPKDLQRAERLKSRPCG